MFIKMENDKEWGDAKVNRSQIQIRSVSSKCISFQILHVIAEGKQRFDPANYIPIITL